MKYGLQRDVSSVVPLNSSDQRSVRKLVGPTGRTVVGAVVVVVVVVGAAVVVVVGATVVVVTEVVT
ncbi:MAG: hypothetical protein ACKO04_15800 [Actinomycetes bacterium]